MGTIADHPIRQWRRDYRLAAALETGTNMGGGVHALLRAGFQHVVTVDVNPGCAKRVQEPAQFVEGDSATMLPRLLDTLPTPALFWLDAHYPDVYTARPTGAAVLPLLAEVRLIVEHERDHRGDVIVADDLRIYGTQGTSGPLPPRSRGGVYGNRHSVPLQPGDPAELAEIHELLGATHDVRVVRRDGAYLVATPQAASPTSR